MILFFDWEVLTILGTLQANPVSPLLLKAASLG
jgi:hypothetical protein